MPPEQAVQDRPAAAADASPSPATSPAEAGQGARAAEVSPVPKAPETAPEAKPASEDVKALKAQLAKLQAQADRSRNVNARLQSQLADIQADYAGAITQLESMQASRNAPDPYRDPEGSARYWQDQLQRQLVRVNTEQVISSELTKLAVETGVIVTKEDKRLRFTSEQAFRESVAAIREQIKGRAAAQQAEREREAAIEAKVRAKLERELGVDRFDGASGGSGRSDTVPDDPQQLLARIRRDPGYYARNREQILAAAERRGVFGGDRIGPSRRPDGRFAARD